MARWFPFGRRARGDGREIKARALGLSDELGAFLRLGEINAASPGSALHLYEQSTAVSVPVNMVAESFAVIEPILIAKDDRVERDHPVLDFLRRPSPFFPRELFLETLAKDFLVTGEAAVVLLGNVGREPLEAQPVSPRAISPLQGPGGNARAFNVAGNTLSGSYLGRRDGRRWRYFDGTLRELKHFRNYSTRNSSVLRGQSPLVPASKEAKQHILGSRHNASLLERGGRVFLVFHYRQDMKQDDFEEVDRRVNEKFGGADNAGKIVVSTGQELDIKQVSSSNRDMDFSTLQNIARQAVALQYRVPLPLVTAERQTFSNYREAKLALYDDAVIPLSRKLYGFLSEVLLPRFGLDLGEARLTHDPDDVTALVMRRNDELVKRKTIGVETDNELRALMGREPYEGGDSVFKPISVQPVGTDLFTEDNSPDLLEDPEATP